MMVHFVKFHRSSRNASRVINRVAKLSDHPHPLHPYHSRIDPRAAVLTGKLSYKGDVELAERLKVWMQTVVVRGAAGGEMLEPASRDKWQRDGDAHDCAICRQSFKVHASPLLVNLYVTLPKDS